MVPQTSFPVTVLVLTLCWRTGQSIEIEILGGKNALGIDFIKDRTPYLRNGCGPMFIKAIRSDKGMWTRVHP